MTHLGIRHLENCQCAWCQPARAFYGPPQHPEECPCTDCIIRRRVERDSRRESYVQLVTSEDEIELAQIWASTFDCGNRS